VERGGSSSRPRFRFRIPASRAARGFEKKEREDEENSEITLLCVFAPSREALFLNLIYELNAIRLQAEF
jgi:hypothetical protein